MCQSKPPRFIDPAVSLVDGETPRIAGRPAVITVCRAVLWSGPPTCRRTMTVSCARDRAGIGRKVYANEGTKESGGRDGHGRPGPLRRHEVSWGSGEDVSTRSLRGSHGRAFRGGRYLPVGWPGVGISARSGLEEVVHKPSAIFGTFEGVHRQVNAKDRRAKLRSDAGPVRLPRPGRMRAKQKTGSSPTVGPTVRARVPCTRDCVQPPAHSPHNVPHSRA